MKHIPKTLLLTFLTLFLLVLSLGTASAADAPKPMKWVKGKVEAALVILDKKVTAELEKARNAELRTLIDSIVDYDDLARRSLGDHWEERTEEERTQYRALFKQLVELTYIDRLGDKDQDVKYTVEWDSESQTASEGHAIAFVLYEDTETELEFILKPEAAEWALFDIAIDGASLEDTYRRNYSKIIDEEGYPKLVEKMQKRIDELEAKK